MPGIYKYGFRSTVPENEAKVEALEMVAKSDTGVIRSVEIVCTPEHQEAGEYLVKIVIDPPMPEPLVPHTDALVAEREQLLGRLSEIDAQMGAS